MPKAERQMKVPTSTWRRLKRLAASRGQFIHKTVDDASKMLESRMAEEAPARSAGQPNDQSAGPTEDAPLT